MPGNRVSLDNPVFAGRLRSSGRRPTYERRAAAPVRTRTISDVRPTATRPQLKVASPVKAIATKPAPAATRRVRVASAPTPLLSRQSRSQVLRRQALKSRPAAGRRKSRRLSLKSTLLTSMAVTLFIMAVGIGISSFRTNHQVAAQVKRIADTNEKAEGSSADPAVPTETRPAGNISDYKVAATLPRVISIPKLGVEARVLRLGVKANNELKAPSNIFDTGWYEGSSKPGEAGAMLIDGHVSGPTQRGVFYGLKTLQPGDVIKVERGDGTVFNYRVHSLKTYDADKVDMAAALTPIVAGKAGLNLITCAGDVDSSGTGFTRRTIVFAQAE